MVSFWQGIRPRECSSRNPSLLPPQGREAATPTKSDAAGRAADSLEHATAPAPCPSGPASGSSGGTPRAPLAAPEARGSGGSGAAEGAAPATAAGARDGGGGGGGGEGEGEYSSGNCGVSATPSRDLELAMSDLELRLEIIRPEELKVVKLLGAGERRRSGGGSGWGFLGPRGWGLGACGEGRWALLPSRLSTQHAPPPLPSPRQAASARSSSAAGTLPRWQSSRSTPSC
jgi:hypothetical protein